MTARVIDDNIPPTGLLEVSESPRKRPRSENSSRMSWSLMDRRTDQEVLQEMGVSLLEPDDNDLQFEANISSGHLHKSLKRKRDIENVNPNVNCITSPRKHSPKSPRGKASPGAGTSKLRSPRSTDKTRPVQTDAPSDSLWSEHPLDEETPVAQLSAAPPVFGCACDAQPDYSPARTPRAPPFVSTPGASHSAAGGASFVSLSEEVVLAVFRWLPKRTLAHCMLVCKRWHRVASDETLWQRLDLGNKSLNRDALGRILDRKPIIVRLASSEIGEWHPTTPPSPSRVQYLDLSVCTIDNQTLNCLLERCPSLKKLSLESVQLEDATCRLIGKCSNLETLNLTMAQGITDVGLASILKGCTGLQALNISWCRLSAEALAVLVSELPRRLQRLNVGGAKNITNDMVVQLVSRCPRLLELDLSDCSRVTGVALTAVQTLTRLEHLALSRCYLLPPHVLTKLGSMASLQYLEIWGMLHGGSMSALRAALPAIQVNQFMFSAIARPTVGTRRTSIWGLRTRD